jgi:hypothetical protein
LTLRHSFIVGYAALACVMFLRANLTESQTRYLAPDALKTGMIVVQL